MEESIPLEGRRWKKRLPPLNHDRAAGDAFLLFLLRRADRKYIFQSKAERRALSVKRTFFTLGMLGYAYLGA
ncbi:MAG: hypothetical protein ACLUIQ_05300 [Dialister invisus]